MNEEILNFNDFGFKESKKIEVAQKHKIFCDLTVESCADLRMETIESFLKNGIVIDTVKFKQDDLSYEQQQPYDIETYKKCLTVLDIMTNDVEEAAHVKIDDADREKKIAAILIKRLIALTEYNYNYYNKLKLNQTTKEEDIINGSLIGALLNKKCVCTGFAEAIRNLFLYCGIEVRYIGSDNTKLNGRGHAWNQAKLDGEWMNIDVIADWDYIKEEEEPEFCFKSDQDFGHDKYKPYRKTEECKKSIPIQIVMEYMRYEEEEKNMPFKRLVKFGIINNEISNSEVVAYEEQQRMKENLQYQS